jgi:hypothetical protein
VDPVYRSRALWTGIAGMSILALARANPFNYSEDGIKFVSTKSGRVSRWSQGTDLAQPIPYAIRG